MVEWLRVILLGIVEGVTEFLPISSTGHLILAEDLLPLRDSLAGTFEIFIQIGAVLAVIVYYRRDLIQQFQNLFLSDAVDTTQHDNARQLWVGIALAFIPAAVLGLLFGNLIDNWLFRPNVVAIALIVGGILFIVVEQFLTAEKRQETSIDTQPLSLRQALIVGTWQVLALVPGMSRSGMSIIGGMLAGVDRQRATQFSFYLALPTLGGATVYTLLRNISEIDSNGLWLLLLGTVVSGIVAWISIDWLLRYVATNSFIPFGYYRIILGIVILIWQIIF